METPVRLHVLAAGLCRIWMERFYDDHPQQVQNETAALYRDTTRRMLQRAERDLDAVTSMFD